MSYVLSDTLQSAVFTALSSDNLLLGLTGGAIYDALPKGAVPALYVTLGPEKVRDRSDVSARAAVHEFSIMVHSDAPGFLSAKEVATRISEVLDDADLSLARGRLIRLDFLKAEARQRGRRREIVIWFRAFVEDNAAA